MTEPATKENSVFDGGEENNRETEHAFFVTILLDAKSLRPQAISLFVHFLVIICLLLIGFKNYNPPSLNISSSNQSGNSLDDIEQLDLELPIEQENDTEEDSESDSESLENAVQESVEFAAETAELSDAVDLASEIPVDFGVQQTGLESEFAEPSELKKMSKAQLARKLGGSLGSERAVQDALAWLAKHQYPDGSWRMAHNKCPGCDGKCKNNGKAAAPTAATGLALLPFLAAGHHHQTQCKYKDVVNKGLAFLVSQMRKTTFGGDFRSRLTGSKSTGGSMYAHGIATLALSEAYSITRDRRLKPFVISGVRFIENTQGTAGGWSYNGTPKSASTTISLTGWQVVALFSAEKAGIKTNPRTWAGIVKYMNLNRNYANGNGDGRYGYSHTHVDNGPTAAQPIGLLAELVLSKGNFSPSFIKRMNKLIEDGPNPSMAYHNYYAQQLVFNYTGGSGHQWKAWNQKMLNIVIPKQAKEGHQQGSWFQTGAPHFLRNGGRMMDTTLNTLIISVYFRHLPMFTGGTIDSDDIEEFDLTK